MSVALDLAARACCLAAAGWLYGHAFASGPGAGHDFDNLVRSKFVHCAFYKDYDTDRDGNRVLVEGRSDALMYFQGIDLKRETARAIYTRLAGAREVRVIQTDKLLHFVDDVDGMFIMTTVYSCLEWDDKRGMCVTYGAANLRHFDARALYRPDTVYEALKDSADPGFCDYSFIGVQEASRDRR